MANTAINMNAAGNGYLGVPAIAVAQGQIYNQGTASSLGSVLTGIGTSTTDNSGAAITLNFIDGTQSLGQYNVVVSLQSATAAATINGVANQVQYSGVGAMGQFKVGQTFVTAGFSNSGNNASSTITAVTSSYVQVTNSGGVAETNYSATGTVTVGRKVVAVRAVHSALSFAGVADSATNGSGVLSVSSITNKACVLTANNTIPAGQFSVLFDVYFDN